MRTGFLVISVLALSLGACASVPKVTDPSGVDISLKVLPETIVATRYGDAYTQSDPFIVPGSILTGNPSEFIVVEVTMIAARTSTVSLVAMSAKAADGANVARYYPRSEFQKYTEDWKEDDRSAKLKSVSIGRFYLPQDDFRLSTGRSPFIIVLIGKRPIARPLSIDATFLVNDGAREYSLELP